MEFNTVVAKRHAERAFTDQPVSIATLTKIVATAQQTPSWANAQPWQVVIATGKTVAKIRRTFKQRSAQGDAGNSDLAVAHRTDWAAASQQNMATWNQDLSQYLQRQQVSPQVFSAGQENLFNSPVLVYLVVSAPLNSWEIFDTGAFAQALMLSATDQGVQSMPAYELVKYPDDLRRILGLDQTQRIVMGIGLGYADKQAAINDFRSQRVATQSMLTIKD